VLPEQNNLALVGWAMQAQLNGKSSNEERESVTTRSSLLEVTPPIIAMER
jgi:hypothetical protein